MSNLFNAEALRGQLALVTGASRGIGAAIAERLALAGATVVGTATTEQGAALVSERLGSAGRGAVLDIASDESVQSLFADLQKAEGTPLIVVNNAGITRDNLLLRMKSEEWEDVLATNLSGTYRVCRASLRGMMKAKRGRIVNVASVIGVMGNAGQANYAAAKAGLRAVARILAVDLVSRGIRVNMVSPGPTETPLINRNAGMNPAAVNALREHMIANTPMRRMGEPEEIARAVLFLASDEASFITGVDLFVDGGVLEL